MFNDDAAATWTVAPGQALGADTTSFTAVVTFRACSDGVTGTVNEPDIDMGDDEVTITFTVSPDDPATATCPSNEGVPYQVRLPEAIGDRNLIDGVCLSTEASDTALCTRVAP